MGAGCKKNKVRTELYAAVGSLFWGGIFINTNYVETCTVIENSSLLDNILLHFKSNF